MPKGAERPIGEASTSGIAPRAEPDSPQFPAEQRYTLRDGRICKSVQALPESVREAFLDVHDPVRSLGLSDDTVLYRVTDKKWMNGSQLQVNPHSIAGISNHLAVRDNPLLKDPAIRASYPAKYLANIMAENPAAEFLPVRMRASDLPDPTLNVMVGERAEEGARSYAKNADKVLVKMTLGNLRKAGGGQVFTDEGAAAGGPTCRISLSSSRCPPVNRCPSKQCLPKGTIDAQAREPAWGHLGPLLDADRPGGLRLLERSVLEFVGR